jgi:hypothetical protein
VMSETFSMTLRPWDGEASLGVGEAGTPMANEQLDLVSENNVITTCTFLSNGGRRPQCSLTLPSVGKFLLIAHVVDTAGNEVLTILSLAHGGVSSKLKAVFPQ